MSEFLLELFSEEIPAVMQKDAQEGFSKKFTEFFNNHNIGFERIDCYVGSRRVIIHASGLPKFLPSKEIELKGPRVSAPEQAIEGFCRSNSVTIDMLVKKEVNGREFYFMVDQKPEELTSKVIASNIESVISSYIWPKSMYWGGYKIKWVRPLHNVLCIFDGEIVKFNYGHLESNNQSFGHRFMAPGYFKVESFKDLKKQLADRFVVIDAADRRTIIDEGITKITKNLNIELKHDPVLLDEVVGLVEYPVVLCGRIDKKFLEVPSEILITSMKNHQKYFSTLNKDGSFASYFIFVSNIKSDQEELITGGNEKVLSARLSDALYFYKEDLNTEQSAFQEKLSTVVFHEKIGMLNDKSARLKKLSMFIDSEDRDAIQAAELSKNDIVSKVVVEFPSLQGIIGYYYTKHAGFSERVAELVRNQYKPVGANDDVPVRQFSLLALVDKVDSLVSLMFAGERPTGSKDPYALRRTALGIIRIILECKYDINLNDLIQCAIESFGDDSVSMRKDIVKFIEERAFYYFKNSYSHDVVQAALCFDTDDNLLHTEEKISSIWDLVNSEGFSSLINSYKRANNILGDTQHNNSVDKHLFFNEYERNLYKSFMDADFKLSKAIEDKKYRLAIDALASMTLPLDQFFENVLVKDQDDNIASNRLALLENVRTTFRKLAKFDEL